MLLSIKQLNEDKIGTRDGDIGYVKDFYFNDQQWVVRYMVADTGSRFSGRLVLISPHAFGNFHEDSDFLPVNLTRRQIENSPPIELHKPVSRQYEEEYFRYYGWPSYWTGSEMWGAAAFPVAHPPQRIPDLPPGGGSPSGDDSHLRSMRAVIDYSIQTADETIGRVTDFIVDDRSWGIQHIVVETGHWFSGKEIVVSPRHIDRISYEESKVFVTVTKEAILNAKEYHMPRSVYQEKQKTL